MKKQKKSPQQTLPILKPQIISKVEEKSTKSIKKKAPDGWPPWEAPGYIKHIRASRLSSGRICPASVFMGQAKESRKIDSGNKFTSLGKIGHKWIELRLDQGPQKASEYLNNIQVDNDFRLSLAELWKWLKISELTPAFHSNQSGISVHKEYKMDGFKIADGINITGTMDLIEFIGTKAWITDWKFYNNPSMLPPIEQDLQMYAYAVGIWRQFPEINFVTINRVLCYHLKSETISLELEDLQLAEQALAEQAEFIWDNRTSFRFGAQCSQCLERHFCQHFLEQEKHIGIRKMKPYEGGDFASDADALKFILAIPALQTLIEEGMEAAKRYVKETGHNLFDTTSKQDWGPRERKADSIIDPKGCIAELMSKIGKENALKIIKTTKRAIEKALKENNISPTDRRKFINKLRDLNYISKTESESQWRWMKKD